MEGGEKGRLEKSSRDEQESTVLLQAPVRLQVLMSKPAAASQTTKDAGADRAELLGQACPNS